MPEAFRSYFGIAYDAPTRARFAVPFYPSGALAFSVPPGYRRSRPPARPKLALPCFGFAGDSPRRDATSLQNSFEYKSDCCV